jgi:16S rRNA (guanine527-N7)-methyltransferase
VTTLPEALFTVSLPGLRRPLTTAEGQQFCKYLEILSKWQRMHRLVGSTAAEWMIENIILDSLAFLELVPGDARRVADVGSGAGVPGLPIAIVRPGLEMSLIEIRRRRVSFLATAVRELKLKGVEVLAARVEDLARTHSEHFDVVVMRCAGAPAAVVSPALAILRRGGAMLMTAKRGSTINEMEEIAINMPGGSRRHFLRMFKA